MSKHETHKEKTKTIGEGQSDIEEDNENGEEHQNLESDTLRDDDTKNPWNPGPGRARQ